MAAGLELVAPVTVVAIAEHPRVAGRYRVCCRGPVAGTETVGAESVGERGAGGAGASGCAGVVESVLVLTARGIGALGVRVGGVLDETAWAALRREARVVAAQDVGLRSLASGRRSARDLALRIRRREADAAIVAEAVARLRAFGLVDDGAFAEAEAAARLRRGTVATGQVRRELRRRGVAADVAESAIRAVAADFAVDDAARCRAAAGTRVRQLGGLEPLVARRRLSAWLLRRGFAPGLVMETVRTVLARRGSDEGPDASPGLGADDAWDVGADDVA